MEAASLHLLHPFGNGFCKDIFWNSTKSWNTPHPYLSDCFVQTLLVWIPLGYMMCLLPFDLMHVKGHTGQKVLWTKILVTEVVLDATLLGMSLVEFLFVLSYGNLNPGVRFAQVDLIAPALRFLTMVFAVLSWCVDVKCKCSNSGKQFFFWMIMVLTALPTVLNFIHPDHSVKLLPELFLFILRLLWLLISLLQFALTFVGKSAQSRNTVICQRNCSRFSQFLSKERVDTALQKRQQPEQYASFPSRVMFSFCDRMGFLGWRKTIQQHDLWSMMEDEAASTTVAALQKNWDNEVEKSKRCTSYQPCLKTALWKAFRGKIIFTGIVRVFDDALVMAMPLLLQLFINFMADKSEYSWKGYFYATLMLTTCFTQTVVNNYYLSSSFRLGMCLKSAVMGLIYRKALKLHSAAKEDNSIGEVINLMAVDAQRFMSFMGYVHALWSLPLQTLLVIFFFYLIFGYAAVAGLGIVLLMLPLNTYLFNRVGVLHGHQMKHKDERISLMAEILQGIKLLKLYAWEEAFQKRILGIREHELESLRKAAYYGIFSYCSWVLFPFCTELAVFACYILMDPDHDLTPANVFTALLLVNILRAPAGILSPAISQAIQVITAEKRVKNFLVLNEMDDTYVTYLPQDSTTDLEIYSGNFTWIKQAPAVLNDIHLKVTRGMLVAVIGPVGAGKSSLCAAVLGMMDKISGNVMVKENVAYVPQHPWIQNMSIRDNILFGKVMQSDLYQCVLDACSLTSDLMNFPLGDQTEIGEQGVNLSGGQRQRINLARAVYSGADVFIIDDALSAVDSNVGCHIFEKVIGPNGLLKDKTRIFCTHGTAFLPKTDLVVTISDGRITHAQTFRELKKSKAGLGTFVNTLRGEDFDQTDTETLAATTSDGSERSAIENLYRKKKTLAESDHKIVGMDQVQARDDHSYKDEQTQNDVGWGVYFTLAKCLSYPVVFGLFALFTLYTAAGFGASFWLAIWVDKSENALRYSRLFYLALFGAFGLAQTLFLFGFAACLSRGRSKSSRFQHEMLLGRILRCPLWFFDTTPIGRIQTRFSRDLDTVDLVLPANIEFYFYNLFGILGTIVLICITIPYLCGVFLLLILFYYGMQRLYVTTTRQINRLESISRAPVLSHLQESVGGIGVIRASRQAERFIKHNESLIDKNMQAVYVEIVVSRWIAVRLEFLGTLVTFLVALLAVIGRNRSWGVSAMDAGLALSYTMTVTLLLNWLLWVAGDLESNVISIERIDRYLQAPQEAPWHIPTLNADSNWPSVGAVNFRSYTASYNASTAVLKDVTASINGGEKIGIVGRTGAGKSSLALALFRIIEATAGCITIDDVDIAQLGLHDLRTCITILPQEPILFTGTIRSNLDPLEKYSDERIWMILEHCSLKTHVMSQSDNLSHAVVKGGQNYSVGQRQLLCLARALLRQTKIVVLDEATAAVDMDTDASIQEAVRKNFAGCTVLVVAHRLDTILDSSRIMVLENGRLAEFASPDLLLNDKNSLFYELAKAANLVA